MSVCLNVLTVEIFDLFSECFDEFVLYLIVYQYVIWCNASLSAVKRLAPCNSLCGYSDVSRLVYYARTFASELQNDRGQVSLGGLHYFLAK